MKKLTGGMVKDSARIDQAEGTMRDALNANLNIQKGSIVNEYGTYEYPQNRNFKVLGHVTIDNDNIVLFGRDRVVAPVPGVTAANYNDEIRILNTKNQEVVVLYRDDQLNFRETHIIQCEFRKNQANEVLVYFTDGYKKVEEAYPGFDYVSTTNPPRVINITKQLQWRYNGGEPENLYNTTNTRHKLQLFPRVGSHCMFEKAEIITGGVVVTGAYYLALAYKDNTGLETNYFTMSNPVYITEGGETALPTASFIGAQGGSPTNKSIAWTITVPGDMEYEQIQPCVVQLIDETKTFFKLPSVQSIKGGLQIITYTGSETVEILSDQDVIVDDVTYTSASNLSQLDNRLYLGNLTTNKDIGFQPFAHNIEIEPVVDIRTGFDPEYYDTFVLNQGYSQLLKAFDAPVGQDYQLKYNFTAGSGWSPSSPREIVSKSYFDLLNHHFIDSTAAFNTKKGYRDPRYSFKQKSFRRGEVYAFYISFVLKDGTETFAYHIPGRAPGSVLAGQQTLYHPAGYKKITFKAEDPSDPSDFQHITVVYQTIPQATIDQGTNGGNEALGQWDNTGYSAGIYRTTGAYAQINENISVSNFNANSLACSIDASVATDAVAGGGAPNGFIGADSSAGGAFGAGFTGSTVTNKLELWLNAHVPALTGGKEWKEIVTEVDSEVCAGGSGTVYLLQSAYAGEIATISETDLVAEHDLDGIYSATGVRPEELREQDRNIKIYQAMNTSSVNTTGSDMGFWENHNEKYPNTQDFLIAGVNPDGSVSVDPTNTLAGKNVRHHRFPSATHDGFEVVKTERATAFNFPEQVRKADGSVRNTPSYLDGQGVLVAHENVRILGFKLSKLVVPKFILSQVQGYKLYYAKRKPESRTVLGQSLAIPAHPRMASVPEQSLALAVQGPYKKAFYMCGTLDHTNDSSLDIYGSWRPPVDEAFSGQRYWGQPVFKFHDFTMLRKQQSLAAATHVECQAAVVFRMFAGGPGNYVQPADYTKLRDAYRSGGAYVDNGELQFNDVSRKDQASTVFPSLGWVSPDMKNTNDFYYHDPLHVNNITNDEDEIVGINRVLDISDTFNLDIHEMNEDLKKNKRSRMIRRGDDLREPTAENPDETIIEREAKKARIRAWYTSVMVGTVYLSPRTALKSQSVIKAGDFKGEGAGGSQWLGRFWGGDIYDNSVSLAIEPKGATFLPGRSLFETGNVSSFKGVSFLYNEAGESCIALSLISGLPTLRGHLPRWNADWLGPGNSYGLTRWGEANRWLFPDAATDGIPLTYQYYGDNQSLSNFLQGSESNGRYDPALFRGLNYTIKASNQLFGMPMAWLLNVCAVKTDVFNPFDSQQLVWTGYYQQIKNTNLVTGAAQDQKQNTENYYAGASTTVNTAGRVFGGDTYISRYTFRSTSTTYGHCFWRAASRRGDKGAVFSDAVNQNTELAAFMSDAAGVDSDRFQADIPMERDPNRHSSNDSRFGTSNGSTPIWNWDKNKLDDFGYTGGDFRTAALDSLGILKDTTNWVKGNVNPVSTLFSFICESDDNLGFRHVNDSVKGVQTKVFGHDSANQVLFKPPTEDLTKADNMLYSEHYSALQDMKVAVPLPSVSQLADIDQFPRRVVRSVVDSGSLADGYRTFRALDFADIASHRGEIMNLFVNRGILFIHTNRSLFLTKGKEELQISPVNAFIGSGDIFAQDPDEVQEATIGHGGTTSRHCHVTTPQGHFYINYKDRAFYSAGPNGIETIGKGMETWLRDNLPFAVEQLGIDLNSPDAAANGFFVDSPAGTNVPIGFTMGYDPMFRRVLLTKREPVPTKQFMDDFNAGNIQIINNIPHYVGEDGLIYTATEEVLEGESRYELIDPDRRVFVPDTGSDDSNGEDLDPPGQTGEVFAGPIWFGNPRYFTQSGWTISYYPDYGVFGSRHSYLPNLYASTSQHLISFTDNGIDNPGQDNEETNIISSWEHSNNENPCRFYGRLYNFEIEYIDNTAKAEAKLYSSIYYYAEAAVADSVYTSELKKVTDTVFNTFYVYNSTQISGTSTAINYLNNARLVDKTWYINDFRDMSKQQTITEGNLISGTENVSGYITTEVTSTPQNITMFLEEGSPNLEYVETNKQWYNKRKLIDHYLAVRLIADNSNRNLVYLYGVGTKFRKSYR